MSSNQFTSTGYVIFSRFDSKRLPGKALRPVSEKPLLSCVIERVRQASHGRSIIVATSDRSIDDGIAELSLNEKVHIFRGSADDVAGRALNCMDRFKLIRMVRINGDSPFIDPELCHLMVDLAEKSDHDIVTNVFPRSVPHGSSVEIIMRSALQTICRSSNQPHHREHVTSYIYENTEQFKIFNYQSEDAFPNARLTVDTQTDLEKANYIFQQCNGNLKGKSLKQITEIAAEFEAFSTD